MNILQITKYYYPAMTFGGPVRCTYNLSSYLAKRGHNVTVYATDALYINNSTRIGIKQQIIGNVKVFYFPTLTRSYGFFVTPQMFAALQKNLGNFDIVHLHEYRTFQNLSYFFLNASKIPSVITLHGQLFTAYVGDHVDSIALRTAFDSLLGRRMLNRSKRVLALTESEAKKCIKLGVHSNKVIVVPNGVDPDDFSNLLPKGEFKKQFHIVNEKMILYVGRINRRKGIDVLIKACSKLFNHKRDTTLVIAGADDGFLTEARLMVKCLGLESSVIFTGGLTRKQILAAYNDASIVVYAGIQEGFPLVPLEAGIMGKGGEIFVLDMGEPVKIIDLAKDMIRLMGLKVGEDIDIVYTGLRPGEKIHEELVSHSEEIEKTPHEKIMLVKTSSVNWQSFREKIDELLGDMDALDLERTRNMLTSMIAENELN